MPITPEPTTPQTVAPGLRLLLVEDERINRLAVGALLRKQGHIVVEAAAGPDALELFANEPFDAVLLDVLARHDREAQSLVVLEILLRVQRTARADIGAGRSLPSGAEAWMPWPMLFCIRV